MPNWITDLSSETHFFYNSVYYKIISDVIRNTVYLLESHDCEILLLFVWIYLPNNQGIAFGWGAGFTKKNYFR